MLFTTHATIAQNKNAACTRVKRQHSLQKQAYPNPDRWKITSFHFSNIKQNIMGKQ